ncbi:uncharacterized protein MYCFIDRAFT_180039 [Pseudocercospora fijiensis CIRAD86]|uniref:Uncharacterized protein n=1 Tax=Pseudocercospora fijiensis (strain CIRAD86) TaxID=383855 RepID=M2ZYH7_PSEFD|nr:uncharacterized protein MYCFIDRAFT_180039 [Pseudocercospora fijiensis CIRAD86]EME77166.1 hypothetical protein MYCFIDRAFT_180039 [Pseudocercospora fijiensis CIRAD86]
MVNRRVVTQLNALNDPTRNPWRLSGEFNFLILYAIFGDAACQSHQFLSALRDLSAIPNLSFADAVGRIQAARRADPTETGQQGIQPRHARGALESCQADGMQPTKPRSRPKQWTETHGGRSGKKASKQALSKASTAIHASNWNGLQDVSEPELHPSHKEQSDRSAVHMGRDEALQVPGGVQRMGPNTLDQTRHEEQNDEPDEETTDGETTEQSIEQGRFRRPLSGAHKADDSLEIDEDDQQQLDGMAEQDTSFLQDDDSFGGFDCGQQDSDHEQSQSDPQAQSVEANMRNEPSSLQKSATSTYGAAIPTSSFPNPTNSTNSINKTAEPSIVKPHTLPLLSTIDDNSDSPCCRPRPGHASSLPFHMSKRNNVTMRGQDVNRPTKRVRFSDEITDTSPFESAFAELSTETNNFAHLMQGAFDFFQPSSADGQLLASCRPSADGADTAVLSDASTLGRPLCLALADENRRWILAEYHPQTDSLTLHCPEEMITKVDLEKDAFQAQEENNAQARDSNVASALMPRICALLESVRPRPATTGTQNEVQPARRFLSCTTVRLPSFRTYGDTAKGTRNRLIEIAGSAAACAVLLTLGRTISETIDGHLWLFAMHTAAQMSEDMGLIGRMPTSPPMQVQSRPNTTLEELREKANAIEMAQVASQGVMEEIRLHLDRGMTSSRSVEQFRVLRSAISSAISSKPPADHPDDAYIAGLRRTAEDAPAHRRAAAEAFLREELASRDTASKPARVWKDVHKQLGLLQVSHSDRAEASYTEAEETHNRFKKLLEASLSELKKLSLEALELAPVCGWRQCNTMATRLKGMTFERYMIPLCIYHCRRRILMGLVYYITIHAWFLPLNVLRYPCLTRQALLLSWYLEDFAMLIAGDAGRLRRAHEFKDTFGRAKDSAEADEIGAPAGIVGEDLEATLNEI